MTAFTYDQLVDKLMGLGVPRLAAEVRARRECDVSDAAHAAEVERQDRISEKEEQRKCYKIFVAHGCLVYTLSQPRATKQSPGLPDLYIFAPRINDAFWFEVKRPVGGKQSTVQKEFQERCLECGVKYFIGDSSEAWRIVEDLLGKKECTT